MVSYSLVLVIAFSMTNLKLTWSCESGWVKHASSCYHFSHDTESAFVANLACQQLGGSLVAIETASENAFIGGAIQSRDGDAWWIGLNDIREEGVWVWLSSNSPASYISWHSGEPNNIGNDENCAEIAKANKQWYDIACHKFAHYICEKSAGDTEIVG